MKRVILCLLVVFGIAGCFSNEQQDPGVKTSMIHTVWLSSSRVQCQDKAGGCQQIKFVDQGAQSPWLSLSSDIAGLAYTQGIFYKLELQQFSVGHQFHLKQVLKQGSQQFLANTYLRSNQHWRLVSLASIGKIEIKEPQNFPEISISDQGFSGFSGCNRMFGKPEFLFEASDYQQSMIKFGPIAMTRMACREQQLNELEHKMSLMLTQVNHFSVQGEVLSFYQDDRLIATFKAK